MPSVYQNYKGFFIFLSADGDYNDCDHCNKFVTCSNGHMHKKICWPKELKFDKGKGWCGWTSNTCISK